MRWKQAPIDPVWTEQIGALPGLNEIIARLLYQRGLKTPEEITAFLEPKLARLEDPFQITGLEDAVRRVQKALRGEESIVVFGDYDVDGVTSTALLVDILQRFGGKPRYYVPRRLDEGYGLSRIALERVMEDGLPKLLIAVDCGTSSRSEVERLRAQGVDVLIIDHHVSKEALPADAILINPHINDPQSAPWKDLCSVGLVFKLVHGLLKVQRLQGDALAQEIDIKEYLDLVALGTIADLVPLKGENRIFARYGLQTLQSPQRAGLFALFEVAGVDLSRTVDPFDISFRLAPRINASGRLDDAARPIELLLSKDLTACRATARELDGFNQDRQNIEAAITEEAIRMAESVGRDAHGLVLHSPEWHPGVVGIVASRIAQHFHRPTLILGSEDGLAKGSGRSIDGVNLVEALKPCAAFLEKWGGHPMAVGVTAQVDQLNTLREAFSDSVRQLVGGDIPEKSIRIDDWVKPSALTGPFLDEITRLAPFGQGNPEPILAASTVTLRSVRPFGRGHIRFFFERSPGDLLGGVYWRGGENPPPENQPIDIAFRFHWNIWKGRRDPRITLIDWRVAGEEH